MKVTAGALLSLVAAVSIFCAHSAKSEILVDDPDFTEFTVYNSVTGQHAKNGPVFVRADKEEGITAVIRTKRSCSPVFEVAAFGWTLEGLYPAFRIEVGRVPADTLIELHWDLCWSREIADEVRLMDVTGFPGGTMWLDGKGRFVLMPMIEENPEAYHVAPGQLLPDPYNPSEVFNTYRHCKDGGLVVVGPYLAHLWSADGDPAEVSAERLQRIRREYVTVLNERRGYGRVRWRYVSVLCRDPGFTQREWPRDNRSEEELRGND